MQLASILTEQHIVPDMKSEDHWSAIAELVNYLDSQNLLAQESAPDVLAALEERERMTSTGIGSGVAIPHAFSEKIDHIIPVFGRSKTGIDFEAVDNCPVKFVILFIVPKSEYHMHLQTLAAIAKMFNNCTIRKDLIEAPDSAAILEILSRKASR